MGLFSLAPKKATPSSGSSHLASSDDRHDHRHGRDEAANDAHDLRHHGESAANDNDFGDQHGRISPQELRKQVRYDLHEKLGRSKGEAVYMALDAHASDRDYNLGSSRGVSGKEIEGLLHMLKTNHRDNLDDHHIRDVEGILRKHFDD